jgi:hypothetical protein
VGAALAQVSGHFCKTLANKSRSEALNEAKSKAMEAAYQVKPISQDFQVKPIR